MLLTANGRAVAFKGRYVQNPFEYSRRPTREVMIGDVGVGGANPIRVQSMTVADTMDTDLIVKETLGLVHAGCEIVRITAPRMEEARNLGVIKAALPQNGCRVPIVADIHFQPQAALEAAEHVEKVRINPGNYADRKRFEVLEYTDAEYNDELERIHDTFKPLVLRCKELGRALRIGTNHGSLSDRIMNRFGDTPLGMVESALEFIRICRQYDFHSIVVSMKSSNPQVMVQAYRMLCEAFDRENMDYPLHLGVTEAGLGVDGRMKSAVGIGTLLEDGIGDTIRVSLTEDSIHEIPAARRIAARYNSGGAGCSLTTSVQEETAAAEAYFAAVNPYEYKRLETATERVGSTGFGSGQPVKLAVKFDTARTAEWSPAELASFAREGCDLFVFGAQTPSDVLSLVSVHVPVILEARADADGILKLLEESAVGLPTLAAVSILADEVDTNTAARWIDAMNRLKLKFFVSAPAGRALRPWHGASAVGLYAPDSVTGTPRKTRHLPAAFPKTPLIIRADYASHDEALFSGSIQGGSVLLDGLGDILLCDTGTPKESLRFGLDLLQATRLRMSKTEYISCPSCGRTLFDLQEATARIKARTGHLKGVKIAVMGCIVNGPGEMADADFGYVGAGQGKIHLYRGKELVKRNMASETADEELVALIREHGMWVEP